MNGSNHSCDKKIQSRPPLQVLFLFLAPNIAKLIGAVPIFVFRPALSTAPACWHWARLTISKLEEFDRTVATGLRAVFATRAAIKHMKAGGRIINIGSCNAANAFSERSRLRR